MPPIISYMKKNYTRDYLLQTNKPSSADPISLSIKTLREPVNYPIFARATN
jgi:hypothetical protein